MKELTLTYEGGNLRNDSLKCSGKKHPINSGKRREWMLSEMAHYNLILTLTVFDSYKYRPILTVNDLVIIFS